MPWAQENADGVGSQFQVDDRIFRVVRVAYWQPTEQPGQYPVQYAGLMIGKRLKDNLALL